MAHDVFISYAVEDGQVAEKVCRALEERDIKCWMAPRDVPFGADYEEAIVDAITVSPLLVLILSTHSNASQHVKREIQNACAEGSPTEIIPFRIGDVPYNKALRYYLGSAQWLDASTPPLENHLQLLVEHARARLKQGDEQTGSREPILSGTKGVDAAPVVSGTDDVQSFKGTGDGRTFQGTGDGRKPLPVMWLAIGAGALLLVVIVVVFATRSRGNENVTNTPSNLATPAVNANTNSQGNGNAQQRTPTPTPTPTPTRTPMRVTPRNFNLRRTLNRNG
jgi:TIR domain-containing protein